jgi:hypothetical protein
MAYKIVHVFDEYKTCTKCWKDKHTSEFYKSSSSHDGMRPECKACAKERHKGYVPKEKRSTSKNRIYTLKYKYGLTVEDFNRMVEDQDGRCMICDDRYDDKLVIDHCHETSAVRGLLCSNCNSALGLLRDDPEIVTNAARYLRQHGKV